MKYADALRIGGETDQEAIWRYVRAGWPWDTVAVMFGTSKKNVRKVARAKRSRS